MDDLKKGLYEMCVNYIQNRIDAAQQAIEEAQKASNDDTKSSAGDKYETSREMMQQETNRNLGQLNEANKLKVALNLVSIAGTSKKAETGNVIITNRGNFYIAVGAGMLSFNGKTYFAISPASPIGIKLKGLKAGDEFKLKDISYLIEKII